MLGRAEELADQTTSPWDPGPWTLPYSRETPTPTRKLISRPAVLTQYEGGAVYCITVRTVLTRKGWDMLVWTLADAGYEGVWILG